MIRVIVGPPCAGKSTHVREYAADDDVLIDLDVMAQAMGAKDTHSAGEQIHLAARAARRAAIEYLLESGASSWIIHTNPRPDQIEEYRAAGAEFTLIDPGIEECLRRAGEDGRPDGTEKVIRDWYESPPDSAEKPTDLPPKHHRGIFYARRRGEMKIKALPMSRVKAGPDDGLAEGEFLVYPSTFTKTPDSYGDIVKPGAFAETITQWKDSGDTLPGLYGHRMDDPDFFVASAIDMGEDEHGWWVKGEFDLESPKGKQVYRLVKGRRLRQLSFAYDVLDEGAVQLDDGTKANELRKLNVHEFSFVPVGANPQTSVVAVKQIADVITSDIKAGRVLASKHIDSLRSAQEAIGAVIKAAEADQEPKANGEGRTNDEEPARAKSEESRSVPSVEVLAAKYNIEALLAQG